MNWVYVLLASNSVGTIIAIAYAISARRTAAKRKRRNKALLAQITAAEAVARMKPRKAVATASGRERYVHSPITPFWPATGGRAPWVSNHADRKGGV